jgi:hypothetical protein
VSSSFIQKRKYTKGYHFDLLTKKAVSHQPIAISQKHSSSKEIKPVHGKEIVLVDENRMDDGIKNLPNDDLIASINNEHITISKLNINLLDENKVSYRKNVLNEPPKKSTAQILNEISIALLILLIVTFSLIFVPQAAFMLLTTKLIFRILLILEILSFSVAAAYHYKTRNLNKSHASVSGTNNYLSASVDNGTIIIQQKNVLADENFIQQKGDIDDARVIQVDSIIGFIWSMIGLFLFILLILSGISSFFFINGFYLIPVLLCALIGIIFCGVSIDEINFEPLKYKGKKYAIAGIIICGLISIIGIVFVLFIF